MMTIKDLDFFLTSPSIDACFGATDWLATLPQGDTAQSAWEACERPDWLLWLLGLTNKDRLLLIAATAACVRLLPLSPEADKQLTSCERYAAGEIPAKEVIVGMDYRGPQRRNDDRPVWVAGTKDDPTDAWVALHRLDGPDLHHHKTMCAIIRTHFPKIPECDA